ncbi:Transposon protein [Arachis hypogaea]|nr:Transposon protein [Arachis hypogaea]
MHVPRRLIEDRKVRLNAPKDIITEQCASTPNAIEICLLTTIYRWYTWHILKKVPQKLNGYKRHVEIQQEMNHIIWSSLSKESFESSWSDFFY